MLALKARAKRTGPDDYVFATRTGERPSTNNVRKRILAVAVKRANETREAKGLTPLPRGITPHSLRRTFASLLVVLGEDVGVVMDEMGHTDPALALRVYRKPMTRDDAEKARLRALVEGAELAVIGIRADSAPDQAEQQRAA